MPVRQGETMENNARAWKRLTTIEELDALDDDLVVAGYRAGLHDTPDYTQRTQDYWHGFLNGQVDSRRLPLTDDMRLPPEVYREMGRRIFGTTH
jgi:hypothetical protein